MSTGVISEYYLERYVLGELPPDEAGEVERVAAADLRVRASLDGIESSNRDILARYPAAAFKAGLLARLRDAEAGPVPLSEGLRLNPYRVACPRRRPLAFVPFAVALILAAILIGPKIKEVSNALTSGPRIDGTVVKGEAGVDLSITQLLVYKKHGDRTETLTDGNEAGAGALLQLAYVAAAEPYGVILSIDGRGVVTRHFPADAAGSTLLALNKKSLLPNAIELDDAPGFERFFLVTSGTPIDVEAVLGKAGELAKDPGRARRSELDLPAGLKQMSVLILKGEGSR